MEMNRRDYAERLERIKAGTADDDDRRLVKHYRREGFDDDSTDDGSWLFDGDNTDGEIIDQYTELEYRDLQQQCRDRSLSASGTAAALRARLREHDDKSDGE